MLTMKSISGILLVGLLSANAHAADVSVEWKDIESYRDIEAVNGVQERFEQRVMQELTEHWQTLGAQLPEQHKLSIVMTDLDLTGRVEPTFGVGGSSYMRIVDGASYPAMRFSFSYTDAEGKELSSADDVRLRDLGQGSSSKRSIMGSSRDGLYFEKQLMDDWFEKTFKRD
ncbi:DUF3016 domain-containing protein [Pseudidiomarina sediminum]|uniref:DUF3016 domain-containing protein n=1 Tax=Pseudidiomarina sediminum TaxID=431675 RepID=A0A432Z262_9GAMM|nr:DUF3016 domain-containing protein [Pseudidiomarina sediminum]RUO71992.1 DUF3016 domain-containing protein [Pseudidiomarina sediminum]